MVASVARPDVAVQMHFASAIWTLIHPSSLLSSRSRRWRGVGRG
jgi:hypothetical protein